MKNNVILCLVIFLLISACQAKVSKVIVDATKEETPSATSQNPIVSTSESTIVPTASEPETTYPVNNEPSETYPITPTNGLSSEIVIGPEFSIDLPVTIGTTRVTGTGPAGVTLLLVDMNLVDTIYSETTIDYDGRFAFELTNGLPGGISVGIRLGDIGGTNLNPDNFVYNENYIDRYLIGILFDTAQVEN